MDHERPVWHIFTRAGRQGVLYGDDEDRRNLKRIVAAVFGDSKVALLAYCWMLTHYHLLVEGDEEIVSKAMQVMNQVYAVSYNRRHGGRGHLFETSYRRYPKWGSRILAISRYIHQNPLDAVKSERNLADYPWSSYPAYLGRVVDPIVNLRLLEAFGPDQEKARARYEGFVMEGISDFRAAAAHKPPKNDRSRRWERQEQNLRELACFVHAFRRTSSGDLPRALMRQPFCAEKLFVFAANRAGLGSVRLIAEILGISSTSAHRAVEQLSGLVHADPSLEAYFDSWIRRALGGEVEQNS
ncbi:MAG TPA: transposase [Planctomycetota bacterium]|nr:transposase [Planctomycetota bacterium]